EMPSVHGAAVDAAIGGPFRDKMKSIVDGFFKRFSDMPADKASRFPFFADQYAAHLNTLAPTWFDQYEKAGKLDPNGALPVEVLDRIQREARNRALADVKKRLFDSAATNDLASAARLMVPFSSAIADSFMKWGVIIREGGVVAPVLNIWKIWTAPDRAGLVQDQDGNLKVHEDGKYVWYSVDHKTGQRSRLPGGYTPQTEYVVFQLPSGLAPETQSGARLVSYINKDSFNTFLGIPTAGPLVAVPANEFELKHP